MELLVNSAIASKVSGALQSTEFEEQMLKLDIAANFRSCETTVGILTMCYTGAELLEPINVFLKPSRTRKLVVAWRFEARDQRKLRCARDRVSIELSQSESTPQGFTPGKSRKFLQFEKMEAKILTYSNVPPREFLVLYCIAGVRELEQRISIRGDLPSAIQSGGICVEEVRDVLIAIETEAYLHQLFRRCRRGFRMEACHRRGPAVPGAFPKPAVVEIDPDCISRK